MIANVAQEKLYLHPTANCKVGASWLTFPLTNEDVEYIQTDAFIEKAAKWLEDNAIEYWGTEAVDNGMMIDDFKKAMKL